MKILSKKKSGSYVILKGLTDYKPADMEYREIYGVGVLQKRNNENPLGRFNVVVENEKVSRYLLYVIVSNRLIANFFDFETLFIDSSNESYKIVLAATFLCCCGCCSSSLLQS